MTLSSSRLRLFPRLAAAMAVFGVLLAGAGWAAAQSEKPGREKAKQKFMEKMKQQKKGQQPAPKPTAAKKPTPRPPADNDHVNPLAASLQSPEIDTLLEKELEKLSIELSPLTKDEDFLRRAYIDLTGKPPTPDKLDAFLKDTDPAKRSKVIDELLATDDYARNWARYWRDVIGYHAIDRRATIGARKFEDWLAEQFKKNVRWNKIATELITATGPVAEEGRTFLIFSQFDMENTPVNLAAETTRVFMGIQISCAQCHDHPYDEWKREQFHETAAFFARTLVRRDPGGDPRSFQVTSLDEQFPGLAKGKAVPAKKGGRASPEHRMPDKEDPEKMHVMHPKFLLGQQPDKGLPDEDRRATFARYVTDKSNHWFARAYVNRIWGELMGEGFYEPVDDLGPGRDARFPMVVNRLASAWRASDYDVKWLFRLIMNTEAYQREIRPHDPSAGSMPFAAACPTRLSADQIFDSLVSALAIDESAVAGRLAGAGGPQAARFGAGQGLRGLFNLQFGIDPSTPTEDVQGTIPQALFFMNNGLIVQRTSAQGDTILSRLLDVYNDDEEVARLLYKRVLARAPTDDELATCKAYVEEVGNRREAFEDLLWSLVNSTEFITKR